jgi:hypothetical protein
MSICYSFINGQCLFIVADKHSEMETLSLSFKGPSRNKCCYVLLVSDRHHNCSYWHSTPESVIWKFRCFRCVFHCGLRPNASDTKQHTDDGSHTRDVKSVADISDSAEVTSTLNRTVKQASPIAVTKASIHAHQVVFYITCTHRISSVTGTIQRQDCQSM